MLPLDIAACTAKENLGKSEAKPGPGHWTSESAAHGPDAAPRGASGLRPRDVPAGAARCCFACPSSSCAYLFSVLETMMTRGQTAKGVHGTKKSKNIWIRPFSETVTIYPIIYLLASVRYFGLGDATLWVNYSVTGTQINKTYHPLGFTVCYSEKKWGAETRCSFWT